MFKKFANMLITNKELVAILVLFYVITSTSTTALHTTILGKMVLLSFILLLTYVNKFAGIIAVLVLIVMYHNQSNAVFLTSNGLEGFTATKDASGNVVIDTSGNVIDKIKDIKITTSSTTTAAAAPASTSTSTPTTEGFDLLGTEDTLRKGKQSNAVSVKKPQVNSDIRLLPFENAKYVENFMILG